MIDVRQYLVDRTGGTAVKYKAVGGFPQKPRPGEACGGCARGPAQTRASTAFFPTAWRRKSIPGRISSPPLPGRPPSGRGRRLSDVAVTAATKVAYFHGCGMRMMFPAAAVESLEILRTTTRIILKDNVCCGLPHLAHGLRDDFLTLAKKNIRLYEDADLVVSDCASCGGTLKHIASFFADDPEWKDRAAAFSGKVMDLTEYLAKVGLYAAAEGGCRVDLSRPLPSRAGPGDQSAAARPAEGDREIRRDGRGRYMLRRGRLLSYGLSRHRGKDPRKEARKHRKNRRGRRRDRLSGVSDPVDQGGEGQR